MSYRSAILLSCLVLTVCNACKKTPSIGSPGDLSVTNISDSGAILTWNSATNATAYSIYLATDTNFTTPVAGYNPAVVKTTSLVMTNLTPGTKYFVKLVATLDSDSGRPATTVFTTLDADALVIVGSDNYNTITISPDGNFNLYGLHAKDGTIAWAFPTGANIAGSPVVVDSLVYLAGGDGSIYCLQLNGGQKWKWGPGYSGEAFESTPYIRNGVLYVGDLGGYLYALDARTGAQKWTAALPALYKNIGSSFVMDDSATTIYLTSLDGQAHAFDAATGNIKWSSINTGNPIVSRPALFGDVLYVGGFSRMYAFDAGTGTERWNSTTPGGVQLYSSPVIGNNKVLEGGEDGNFYSVNTADGSLNWMKPLTGPILSSPYVVNGVIYVGATGAVDALDENSGATIWENDNIGAGGAVIYSGPTVSSNYVYVGSVSGTMYCLDKTTGATVWTAAPVGAAFHSSPCVTTYAGKVYYPGVSGMGQQTR